MSPRFGPAVIGEKAYKAQIEEEERTGQGRFGPAVIGERRPDQINVPAAAVGPNVPEDYDSVSVKDLKDLLDKDAGLAAQLFEAEKNRADGPRITAVRALQFAEAANDEPDEDLLEEMKALIDELGS